LRERKLIASREVAGAQQPSTESGFDFMVRHASR
jgi:hypothetical protein